MSITLTKENFVEMLPQLYTMLNTYKSVYVEPDEISSEEEQQLKVALQEYEKWEYITLPEEAYESTEAFTKFLMETDNV